MQMQSEFKLLRSIFNLQQYWLTNLQAFLGPASFKVKIWQILCSWQVIRWIFQWRFQKFDSFLTLALKCFRKQQQRIFLIEAQNNNIISIFLLERVSLSSYFLYLQWFLFCFFFFCRFISIICFIECDTKSWRILCLCCLITFFPDWWLDLLIRLFCDWNIDCFLFNWFLWFFWFWNVNQRWQNILD